MKKSFLYTSIGLLVLMGLVIYGCKKVNGINNNTVVETPFSFYFSDISGVLYNSNDGGITVQKLPFQSDGYPARALCTIYNTIFLAKNNLYLSTNNGINFNHSYDSLLSFPDTTCSKFPIDLNQSMIIAIQDWNYLAIASHEPTGSNNWMGIRVNLYGGTAGDWWSELPDSLYNIGDFNPGLNHQITVTSFTLMPDGVLAAYDAEHNRNFYRTKTTLWNEVTANPDTTGPGAIFGIGSPQNHSGMRLPHHVYAAIISPSYPVADSSSNYSYGHFNQQLIAIDRKDLWRSTAAYYSNDTSRGMGGIYRFAKKAVPMVCNVTFPSLATCLMRHYDGAGLYVLNTNTNTWQPNNKGLGSNLVVNNIAFKENIYKNGKVDRFIFLATNQGIYQSSDMGNSWTMTLAITTSLRSIKTRRVDYIKFVLISCGHDLRCFHH